MTCKWEAIARNWAVTRLGRRSQPLDKWHPSLLSSDVTLAPRQLPTEMEPSDRSPSRKHGQLATTSEIPRYPLQATQGFGYNGGAEPTYPPQALAPARVSLLR